MHLTDSKESTVCRIWLFLFLSQTCFVVVVCFSVKNCVLAHYTQLDYKAQGGNIKVMPLSENWQLTISFSFLSSWTSKIVFTARFENYWFNSILPSIYLHWFIVNCLWHEELHQHVAFCIRSLWPKQSLKNKNISKLTEI